jgi:DNA-binding Lrp family transcriptional regulator
MMKIKSKETITPDELKVLTILQQHAKESIDVIARQCGFSRQKVWRIVKHLEEANIIWGYIAVVDEQAKNLKHFMVLAKRNGLSFDKDIRKEILFTKIDDFPPGLVHMENIYFTHGPFDWILTFNAPNIISAKKYVELTFEKFRKYLKEYTIMEILVPVRKMGLKNPDIKQVIEYL